MCRNILASPLVDVEVGCSVAPVLQNTDMLMRGVTVSTGQLVKVQLRCQGRCLFKILNASCWVNLNLCQVYTLINNIKEPPFPHIIARTSSVLFIFAARMDSCKVVSPVCIPSSKGEVNIFSYLCWLLSFSLLPSFLTTRLLSFSLSFGLHIPIFCTYFFWFPNLFLLLSRDLIYLGHFFSCYVICVANISSLSVHVF